MMAPALPATPRGPSDADTSGFVSLLATVRSEEGAASGVTGGRAPSTVGKASGDGDGSTDGGNDAANLEDLTQSPVAFMPFGPKTMVEPGTTGPELQVLPDMATASGGEPVVPPGATAAAGMEPQVLPGAATAKGAEPRVLPGAAASRAPEPPVLPGEAAMAIALPASRDDDAIEEAVSESPPSIPAPTKPDAAPVQGVLPPLRALAERTARPLDEAVKAADAAPAADGKETAPATTPPSASAPQPAKPATSAPTPVIDSASTPAEAAPAGEPVSSQTEAAAPARDHSLSTLSRATIDATAQIAAQILRKLEGRSTRFEIALRPDELGRVDVKLDIDSEGRLAARLAFDNPAAATDLRGRTDELRRQLEAAGFQLADDAFEFAERDSGSSAFDRGQDARHGQNRAFAAAARLNAEIDLAQPPQWLALSLSPSGVDMKV
ncbi:flagellar hook-length control protein FliK [Brevundimonas sp.]|uniref:flagellar hook-length control protein FliK n=1 Tax=Brevundimonas sp. TaxID=1871086 RepID=UPI002D7833C6|nr:flagellar hook-length control protein FliK [Brevundimonas sp.]